MSIGLVGQKCGMTRIFTEDGASIPVTVIEVTPNRVTQIKSHLTDGYDAIQVTMGKRKQSRVNKPMAGHYAKANVEAGLGLWEFRLEDHELNRVASADAADTDGKITVGSEISVSIFAEGQKVDVIGTSKGKGFAGTVKRWNFATQDATHGNSRSHRAPGSIGQNQSPGHVFPGKKMSGQLGNERVTIQSLELVRIDAERNLLMIKGAIPGPINGKVIIRPAVKVKTKEKSQ